MRRFSVIVLFSLAISHPANSDPLKAVKTNYNLVECLRTLLHNDNDICVRNIRIGFDSNSNLDKWNFGEMVDQLLLSYNFNLTFEIRTIDTIATKITDFNVHRRILFVNSAESFEKFVKLERSRANINDISGHFQFFYVILPPSVERIQNIVPLITRFCVENIIKSLNILTEDSNGIVTIYTYYPFAQSSCRNSQPVIYNYYKNGTLTWKKKVFPYKLQNLWKCPLKVIMWEEVPFFHQNYNTSRWIGIDISILNILASNLNISWNFIISPHGRGEIYKNGTVTNGFKMLTDIGDLMLGGTSITKEGIKSFAITRQYFFTSIKLILKPFETYNSLSLLLVPFDNFTWLTILMIFLGKLIFKTLWRKISYKLKINGRMFSKLLKLVWLLSILIFRSSYECLIFKYLHNTPQEKLPENLDEAIADGYSFICSKSVYNSHLKNLSELNKDGLKIFDTSKSHIVKEFFDSKEKIALIERCEEKIFLKYALFPNQEEYRNWALVKTPILIPSLHMYLPKFSSFTKTMNDRITQLRSSGIAFKTYGESIRDFSDDPKFAEGRKLPKRITMQNLSGAFQLLGAMMGVAVLVFTMEISSQKNKRIQRLLKKFDVN